LVVLQLEQLQPDDDKRLFIRDKVEQFPLHFRLEDSLPIADSVATFRAENDLSTRRPG